MDKKSDVLLRKLLKNWANRQRPPENERARLIWEAAHVSHSNFELNLPVFRPQYKAYPSASINDWPQTLFSWINENSLQIRFQTRLG